MSEMMTSGWFAVKRGFLDHDLFKPDGKFSKAEAWLWMVENAAFRDVTVNIGGKPHEVPRGDLCFSERFMAERFGWSQKALRTFLDKLEAHGAIAQNVAKTGQGTRSKRKQVTLCNYDKYQSAGIKTEAKRNQNGSKEEQVTNNNIPTSSEAADATPLDPAKVMFDAGRSLLMAAGKSKDQAGKLLGRWRNDHGAEAVIAALGRAQREGAIDPVSFIEGCLRFSERQKKPYKTDRYGNPEIGATKVNAKGDHYRYVNHFDGWMREDA